MGSSDRAFQNRPKTFYALSTMDTFDPFLGGMVDGAMLVTEPCQLGVGLQFIGADKSIPFSRLQ